MKKAYEAPSVEKIAFRYRDQVVAASAGGNEENGNSGSGSNPSFGSLTSENWGQNGCKVHALEAVAWAVCDIA